MSSLFASTEDPKNPDAGAAGSTTGMAGIGRPGTEWWSEDARHVKRAPGAYEWWHFEGIDLAGNGVAVTFFEGLPFHPFYLSQLGSWARRKSVSPFSTPQPEVLAEHYPACYLAVYQGSRRVAQFLNLYPPGSFEGRSDLPEIRVGPNRVTLRSDGSFGITARGYPYEIHAGAPRPRMDQILSATLNFVPTFNGVQHVRPFRPPGADGAAHNWILAAPHGKLTGQVQHIGEEGVALFDQPIDSFGYHDHTCGHGPFGWGVKRSGWGHFIGEHFTVAWQRTIMKGRSNNRTDVILLFEEDHHPMVIEAPTIRTERTRTTRWLVAYPSHASLHGSDAKGNSAELLLDHSHVVERSPFHVRLTADAVLTIAGKRQYAGRGVTNVMQLQRLRWPLLSDMVLMSMLQVPADDPLWRQ